MTTIPHKAVQAFKDVFHGSTPKSYDETIKEGLSAALPYLFVSFPVPMNTGELIRALSNMAGNRHSDGVSSVVSAEDRGTIIDGCHNLIVALKLANSIDVSAGLEEFEGIRALSAEPAQAEPDFSKSIAEVIKEESLGGAACGWRSCTGCLETSDGYHCGEYPYSETFKAHVGSGCSACGGIGVVWEHYSKADLAEMQHELLPAAPTSEAGK